jgi:hypothetical protein
MRNWCNVLEACNKDGMPDFDRLRYRRDDANQQAWCL